MYVCMHAEWRSTQARTIIASDGPSAHQHRAEQRSTALHRKWVVGTLHDEDKSNMTIQWMDGWGT